MTELDKADARIESYIYKHIGKKSAREMATDLGVNPEEIIRIKNEILNSVDVLTVEVQKLKLMRSMQEIADSAKEAADNVGEERNRAGLYNSSIAAIKELNRQLSAMSKADNEKIDHLNQKRVQELVNLMMEVVDSTVPEIAKRYDLDVQELFDMFNEALDEASRRRDIS